MSKNRKKYMPIQNSSAGASQSITQLEEANGFSKTSIPDVCPFSDVAACPLKLHNDIKRAERVDHAHKSAEQAVKRTTMLQKIRELGC